MILGTYQETQYLPTQISKPENQIKKGENQNQNQKIKLQKKKIKMKETQNQMKKNSNKNSIIFKLFSLVRFTLASHILKLSNKLPQSSYGWKRIK